MVKIEVTKTLVDAAQFLQDQGVGSRILYTGNESIESIDSMLKKGFKEGKSIRFAVVQEGVLFIREKDIVTRKDWTFFFKKWFKKMKAQTN